MDAASHGLSQAAGPSSHLGGITAALDRLTTHAAALPPKSDLSFHRTLDRKFAKSVDGTSNRLLGLTEQLLTLVEGDTSRPKAGVKGKGRSKLADEQDAVEGFRRSVGNVIDGLLEDADSRLDDVSGQKKKAAIQIDPRMAAAASRKLPGPFAPYPAGKNGQGRLAYDLMFADVDKPQLLFPDAPNTAHNQPWTPTLATKPHSMVPLDHPISTAGLLSPTSAADIKEAELRKRKIREREHPYWYETQHLPYPTRMFEVAAPIPPVEMEDCPLVFVNTPETLEEMVGYLREAKEIAVDLEHHSTRSYFGFTCLMQISTRERDWVVDTLKLRGEIREGKFGDVMVDPSIVKVFHGSDSDILWLERDFDIYIVNLFDTYHATMVLNFPSHSLASLLARYCSVTADKRYQMADWRIRPLPQAMIDYARSDTHYLLYIYDHLRNALLEMSSRPSTPQPGPSADASTPAQDALRKSLRQNPQAALRQVLELSAETAMKMYERDEYQTDGRGSGGWKSLLKKSLPPDSEDTIEAAVMIALHKWRDDVARRLDESPFWVMPTDIIRQIGILRVPKRDLIARILHAKKMLAKDMADDVLQVVVAARNEWTANPPAPKEKTATTDQGRRNPYAPRLRPSSPRPHASSPSARSPSPRPRAPSPPPAVRPPAERQAPPSTFSRPSPVDSLWASLEAVQPASKPKSQSALFGNTVPARRSPSPPARPKSSLFGSTMPAQRPTKQAFGLKKREMSPSFDLVSRRIAEEIHPGSAAATGDEDMGEAVQVAIPAISSQTLQPETVPFVPAAKRTGFTALKEIAAASRAKVAAEKAAQRAPSPVAGGAMLAEAEGSSSAAPIKPAHKSKDEIVQVKRQRKKPAAKAAAASTSATGTPSAPSTSQSGTVDVDTTAPKKAKKPKSKPAAHGDIPVFDYATEGNLLDQPNAPPRAGDEDGPKKKKKKKDKPRPLDAPPPVMIQTPDFGKMPRDMSQPKAGAKSRTFTC